MRGGFLVEVAEDGDAEDGHEDAEGDEAVGGGEEGPVAGEVGAEERGFGEEEEHCVGEMLAVCETTGVVEGRKGGGFSYCSGRR